MFRELGAQPPHLHRALGIARSQELSLLAIKFKTVDGPFILGLLDRNRGFLGALLEIKQLHFTFRERESSVRRGPEQQPRGLAKSPRTAEGC